MLEGRSTLMIYNDGITPQGGLSKHDKRKLVAVYLSLLQIDEFLFSEVIGSPSSWCGIRCSRT